MTDVIVMRARPYDPAVALSMDSPGHPAGLIDDAAPFSVTFYGDTTEVFAAAGVTGFNTTAADSPASTYIPGVLTRPFEYQYAIFGDADLTQPGSFSGGGGMVLSDPRGDLDGWLSYAWDGRDIDIWRGQAGAALSTFSLAARLTCDGWGPLTRTSKTIRLRDMAWRLGQTLPIPRYAGTGGIEGPADLAGKTKPVAIGQVRSVEPVLLDGNKLIYQWTDGTFNDGTPVMFLRADVGGVGWYAYSGDWPDYATLESAAVAPGTVATCDALGLFRMGSVAPAGQEIRVTGNGFAGFDPSVAWSIFSAFAPRAPGFNSLSFDYDWGDDPGGRGWYFASGDTAPTFADAINATTYPHGLYWWPTLDGTIKVRAIRAPEGEAAEVTLDAAAPYTFASEPQIQPVTPRSAVTLLAGRLWSPVARSTMAGSVPEETAALLSAEWVAVKASAENTVGVTNRSARTLTAETCLAVYGAEERAPQLLAIFSTVRHIVTVSVGGLDPLSPPLGKIVEILNFNRLGFGASKKFLCIGVAASVTRNTLELTLWG